MIINIPRVPLYFTVGFRVSQGDIETPEGKDQFATMCTAIGRDAANRNGAGKLAKAKTEWLSEDEAIVILTYEWGVN